jgi:hypothetical protein
MASFATLASSTAYLTLLTQINDRDADLAFALDPASTTVTSPLTNSVRYNSANKRWEKYVSSAWGELIAAATDAYAITVTGVRGGNFYGTITNNGTISGGAGNFTTLQVASSAVWTAASLTNLNQLTNGPAYITSASLSAYALLAGPTFTGVPAAPTAAVNTNTTQIATTGYVMNQGYLLASTAATTYAALASPTLTGVPAAPTAAVNTNTTQIATTAYVVGQGYLTTASAVSTYAPLGGGGASGTWGISVTGNAATAGGFVPSATAGANGRIVVADSSGYIFNSYFNGTDEGTSGTAGAVSAIITKRGDNYYRSTTAGSVAAFLSGQSMNISGSSSSCTGNAASATTATTATNLSGGTVSATTLTATGPLKGNSGSKGWGAITTTTTTGTPTGGSSGDFYFVY